MKASFSRALTPVAILASICLFVVSASGRNPRGPSETIPDAIAYELVLTAAAANPVEFLGRVGLTDKDQVAAVGIIQEFAFERQAHLDALNARHETPEQFQAKCQKLVRIARAELVAGLTTEGAQRFDAFVQGEKAKMHRHHGDGQEIKS